LEHYYVPTQFFFMALVIGVIPMLFKESGARTHFKWQHISVLLVSAVLVASMAFLSPEKSGEPITTLNASTFLMLFLAGWLASMAMLLPGISGSFILLLLGVYPTAIYALSEFHVPLIVTIGSGVIVGFIVSSKGIRYALARFPHMTYAIILGLIAGSVFVVYPGLPADGSTIAISVVTFGLGLGATRLLVMEQK
uniref:DUF368 domain-containing protein n=1 Tax=Cohnella sp. TaxID=1883426 RepID=UPI003562C085